MYFCEELLHFFKDIVMKMSPSVAQQYTQEHLSALQAQRLAHEIAFAPVVFQVSRLMIKFGILQLLSDHNKGLTQKQIAEHTSVSEYAVQVLLEASLSIGTVRVSEDRFVLTKAGWFLLNDESVRINMDFIHEVCYQGLFYMEETLREGRPAGLEVFGQWPTIYEGLSQLPREAQKKWFAFDHHYSDNSFQEALEIVFSSPVKKLLDVGGNTGRWAMQCIGYNPEVEVTIMDLPQQLGLMREATRGKEGADRIKEYPANLLDPKGTFPKGFDVIWMSQFLDCFSQEEVISILRRAAQAMDTHTLLYILESYWDRQQYETGAYCLTQISLYFSVMANGNSKMYYSQDMIRCVEAAGLEVIQIHDHLGKGHSIFVCKKK